MTSKMLAQEVFKRLSKVYPEADCALLHANPFQLLVATILSAQCTDERVNQVTPLLFKEYPAPEQMAKANLESVEKIIHSTGFYRNKAKNIIACAVMLQEKFSGNVPKSMIDLIQLPGVGRKTANVVLGNAFGHREGIVVDTHVKRLAKLIGLTKNENPDMVEKDLVGLFEKQQWVEISHLFIFHGRKICIARRPRCRDCALADICKFNKKNSSK